MIVYPGPAGAGGADNAGHGVNVSGRFEFPAQLESESLSDSTIPVTRVARVVTVAATSPGRPVRGLIKTRIQGQEPESMPVPGPILRT